MKVFSVASMARWNLCYRPELLFPVNWTGTALDILTADTSVIARDRLWLVLREECLGPETLKHFAYLCAREAMSIYADLGTPGIADKCAVYNKYAKEAAEYSVFMSGDSDLYRAARESSKYMAFTKVYSICSEKDDTEARRDIYQQTFESAYEWQVALLIGMLENSSGTN